MFAFGPWLTNNFPFSPSKGSPRWFTGWQGATQMWEEQTNFFRIQGSKFSLTSSPLPLKAYQSAEVLEERMVEIQLGDWRDRGWACCWALVVGGVVVVVVVGGLFSGHRVGPQKKMAGEVGWFRKGEEGASPLLKAWRLRQRADC